jgi:hypothetical protein
MPVASGSIAYLGAARFQGYWNATSNAATGSGLAEAASGPFSTLLEDGGYHSSTDLTASAGDYWQVTGSGTTEIDGQTNWNLNDWSIYSGSAGGSGTWLRLAFEDTIASIIVGDMSSSSFHMGTENDKHIIFTSGSNSFSGSSNLVYDYTNNRVGIRTSSPDDPLHVKESQASTGVTNSIMRLQHHSTDDFADGDGPGIKFTGGDDAAPNNVLGRLAVARDGSNTEGRMEFSAGTNGLETFMTIKSDGNVGIGTTTPNAKLHVAGEITIDSENGIRWENGNNQIYGSGDSGTSYLDFQTSGASRIRIKSDGNVGIGVTDPDELLEVAGDVKVSGANKLYFYDTGGEHVSSDGTDLTVASGNDINLTATGDVNIPSGVGLKFGDDGEYIEGDGTDLRIASSAELDLSAGTSVDINATTGVTIDGTAVSIDGTGDSNFSVIGSGKDLDLSVAGGSAQELRLASAGDGASAIKLNATAGGIDVDAAGAISLDSSAGSIDINVVDGQTVNIGLNGGVEQIIAPHGTAGSELYSVINTAGTTDGSAAAGAVLLSSVAGGIGLSWADGKDLWAEGGRAVITANEDVANCIKLHADAGTSQTITVVNDAGTGVSAIGLTSIAGGIKLASGLDSAASIHLAGYGMTFDGGDNNDSFLFNNSPISLEQISAPSSTTNKLYNVGGTLTFNGTAVGGTITALNNQTESRLVTVGSTTTELDAEANLTYDGTTFNIHDNLDITGSLSGELNGIVDFRINMKHNLTGQFSDKDGSQFLYLVPTGATRGPAINAVGGGNSGLGFATSGSSKARIFHNEEGDDFLVISGSSAGIALSGSTVGVDGQLLVGPGVATTHNIHVRSATDASIYLEADTNNTPESDNVFIKMTQDGNLVKSIFGLTGADGTDPEGTAYTGILNNSIFLGSPTTGVGLQLGTNDAVRFTIASAGKVGIATTVPEHTLSVTGTFGVSGNVTLVTDLNVGDDLSLTSDSAILNFGDGNDVTFTHDGGTGMDITSAGNLDIESTAGSITLGASLADGQTLKLGKNGAVEAIIAPHGTAGSELYSVINTAGTTDGADAAGSILLSSVAGGIGLAWADGKDLWAEGGKFRVVANEDANRCIYLHADAGTSQTIHLLNDAGTSATEGAAAIQLLASAGGVNIKGNLDGANAVLLTADGGTSATMVVHNDQGTVDGTAGAGSITLLSDAGGIGLSWADGKDLWAEGGRAIITANEDAADCIKLHADAGTSQTVTVVNDAGTDVAAIGLTSTAGGISLSAGAIRNTHDFATTAPLSMAQFDTDGEWSGTVIKYSPGANESPTLGQLYFLHTDGTWNQTDANDVTTGASQMLGIGLGNARSVGLLISGFIRIPDTEIENVPGSNASPGLPLYVSTTAGHINFTAPSGTGDFVRIVGYAIQDSTDVLIYFDPDKTWVEVA